MSSKQQHSPQHEKLLKKQSLEQHEVPEVLNIIKKFAVPTAVVIIACCGTYLVTHYLKAAKATKEAKADSAMVKARSAEDFQKIVDDYSSTSTAPIAMMNLAMAKFSEGDYEAAQKVYSDFLKKYADSDMALQAELNVITCRESKGELSEAHLLYSEFSQKHKDSFLAPVAMMGRARCLAAMGNTAEAKRAYEDLVVSYPGSSWSDVADTRIQVINSKLR